jgi:hypothetical protein
MSDETVSSGKRVQVVKAENSMTKAERIKADMDAAFKSGDADRLLALAQVAKATKLLWSGVCSHFDSNFDKLAMFGNGETLTGTVANETGEFPVVSRIRDKSDKVGRPAKAKPANPLVNSDY